MTEQNMPADWAIEEAMERGRIHHLNIAYVKAAPRNYSLTIELARMIEKHEKPPVDPDVLAVREILGAYCDGFGNDCAASNYRSGGNDNYTTFLAALEAYRRVKGGAE